MAYSYEQPEKYSDYIFVSSPRIFIRDYAAANLYSGQQLLAVSTPLTGWTDVGLISNVAIPVPEISRNCSSVFPRPRGRVSSSPGKLRSR